MSVKFEINPVSSVIAENFGIFTRETQMFQKFIYQIIKYESFKVTFRSAFN